MLLSDFFWEDLKKYYLAEVSLFPMFYTHKIHLAVFAEFS
jgi:hypothetical protein